HRFRRCPLFPARAADERGTRVTVVLEATDAVVRRGPREVLHGVSLALHEGDAVALVGPNAAGKSTLVRTLAGLLRPERGRVLLLDEPGAHLDVGHQLGLFRVLDQARAGGVAVLAVVHDLQRAAAWAGRMVLLDEGRVAAEGPPDEVLTSAEAARAFRVSVRAHALPGASHPLYSFEEP